MARHLGCPMSELEVIETTTSEIRADLMAELQTLERQCDFLSEEIHNIPLIEIELEKNGLDQVASDRQAD